MSIEIEKIPFTRFAKQKSPFEIISILELYKITSVHVTLPNIKADLMIKLLDQNNGKLSNNKKGKHFKDLEEDEFKIIENAFQDIFTEE